MATVIGDGASLGEAAVICAAGVATITSLGVATVGQYGEKWSAGLSADDLKARYGRFQFMKLGKQLIHNS